MKALVLCVLAVLTVLMLAAGVFWSLGCRAAAVVEDVAQVQVHREAYIGRTVTVLALLHGASPTSDYTVGWSSWSGPGGTGLFSLRLTSPDQLAPLVRAAQVARNVRWFRVTLLVTPENTSDPWELGELVCWEIVSQ